MKRISFLISNDFAYDQRMQKICSTLDQNGFQLDLFYPKRSIRSNNDQSYLRPFKTHFKKGIGFYLELNHRLFWRNIFRSFDGISAVDLDTLPAAVLLKWLRKKPLILDCHEWFEETPEVYGRKWIY